MHNSLPPGINILRTSIDQINQISSIFQINSPDYILLKNIIKTEESLSSSSDFINSKNCIIYIQILMLMAISMYSGIFIPSIKTFSSKNNKVTITWDNCLHDTFKFGILDKNFEKFILSYKKLIYPGQNAGKELASSIVARLGRELIYYTIQLKSSQSMLDKIITKKESMVEILNNNHTKDSFFIIMSCLPVEELNTLFLYVQQFLPNDLTFKLKNHTFNITQLFESPTLDMKSLMQKTIVYFDMYFVANAPIIQEITKSKTTVFMRDLIKKDLVVKKIQENAISLKENQINIRLKLYDIFIKHIQSMR